jgi:hypothetical protein
MNFSTLSSINWAANGEGTTQYSATGNGSAVYAINNKIQIFDSAGNRIFGVANP